MTVLGHSVGELGTILLQNTPHFRSVSSCIDQSALLFVDRVALQNAEEAVNFTGFLVNMLSFSIVQGDHFGRVSAFQVLLQSIKSYSSLRPSLLVHQKLDFS